MNAIRKRVIDRDDMRVLTLQGENERLAALVRELRDALEFVMDSYMADCGGPTDKMNIEDMTNLLKKSEAA
jgi:hypothetical protein